MLLLASVAKVVTDELRRKVEAQFAQQQAADEAPAMSEVQIAVIKRSMAQFMQVGDKRKKRGGGVLSAVYRTKPIISSMPLFLTNEVRFGSHSLSSPRKQKAVLSCL